MGHLRAQALVGILAAQGTGLQLDRPAIHVITEPKASRANPILTFTGRDSFQLLDRVLAAAVVRVRLENVSHASKEFWKAGMFGSQFPEVPDQTGWL